VIEDAIAELPVAQRTVISLRDIEGWSSEEVCEALEISAGNQRILLHVRAAGSGTRSRASTARSRRSTTTP
jgi:DNA-directed RNA polymerase specialized sigma24 family protein